MQRRSAAGSGRVPAGKRRGVQLEAGERLLAMLGTFTSAHVEHPHPHGDSQPPATCRGMGTPTLGRAAKRRPASHSKCSPSLWREPTPTLLAQASSSPQIRRIGGWVVQGATRICCRTCELHACPLPYLVEDVACSSLCVHAESPGSAQSPGSALPLPTAVIAWASYQHRSSPTPEALPP
jgi:hypothetical protein